MDASGKAINSARVLNQLKDGCVECICPLGIQNKDLFLELAQNDSLPVNYVTIPGFTRECWTLLNTLDHTTTELVVGEPDLVEEIKDSEGKILDLVKQKLSDCDGVLFAGSRPKYFSEGLIPYIARMVTDANKIFLADYHGDDLNRTLEVCTPEIIKINSEEFQETFGYPAFIDDDVLKNAVINLSKKLNNIVIVTRGTKSTFAALKGEFEEFPVEKIIPVNTTACGDSFSAGFLFEYVTTGKFYDSLAKGTWCAARNAELEAPGTIK